MIIEINISDDTILPNTKRIKLAIIDGDTVKSIDQLQPLACLSSEMARDCWIEKIQEEVNGEIKKYIVEHW